MQKVENPFVLRLFESKKEIFLFFAFALLVFSYNLYHKHTQYESLTQKKFQYLSAKVLSHYQKIGKNGKSYHVLKIRSDDGYTFYTTNREDIKDLNGREISVGIITDKVDFKSFLGGFYAPSFDIRLYASAQELSSSLQEKIINQHHDSSMKELFSALFLAIPISKELREKISNWGISHLIAISGYHLGVLFAIGYFLLNFPYAFLQARYFPYRNRRFDLTVMMLLVLTGYLLLLGVVPSVIRAFVMLIIGFWLFHRNFKIISFEVLAVTVVLILAMLPEFLFSIGFWFSVSGVFFIYLFLYHFGYLKNWQIFILLNFWVYIAMIPITHVIFPKFTMLHLLSPFMTMLFSLFYPLEMLLHLIGQGSLLDTMVQHMLDVTPKIYDFTIPLWGLGLYLLFSLLAIFEKRLIIVMGLLQLGFLFFV